MGDYLHKEPIRLFSDESRIGLLLLRSGSPNTRLWRKLDRGPSVVLGGSKLEAPKRGTSSECLEKSN